MSDLPRSRDAIVKNFQPSGPELHNNMQGSWAVTYAQRIIDDPYAHIDALVEAGVLSQIDHSEFYAGCAYRVQPRKPCPDWIEVGYGRQSCVLESGHAGPHSSPTPASQSGDVRVMWLSGP